MAELENWVNSTISSKPVVVFSKTPCPYCKAAKNALSKVPNDDKVIIELDQRKEKDSDKIQTILAQITGGRSVPRVFIGGKFIGGGDDTVAFEKSGKLYELLREAGVHI